MSDENKKPNDFHQLISLFERGIEAELNEDSINMSLEELRAHYQAQGQDLGAMARAARATHSVQEQSAVDDLRLHLVVSNTETIPEKTDVETGFPRFQQDNGTKTEGSVSRIVPRFLMAASDKIDAPADIAVQEQTPAPVVEFAVLVVEAGSLRLYDDGTAVYAQFPANEAPTILRLGTESYSVSRRNGSERLFEIEGLSTFDAAMFVRRHKRSPQEFGASWNAIK
jgi:hypothetical protein